MIWSVIIIARNWYVFAWFSVLSSFCLRALSKNKLKRFPGAAFINCRSLEYLWVRFLKHIISIDYFSTAIKVRPIYTFQHFCSGKLCRRVTYNFIATRRKKSRFLQPVTYFKCVCLSLGLFLCFPRNRSSIGTYHQLACAKKCQILTQIKSPTNKISEESRPFSPSFVFWLASFMLFLLFYLEDPLTTTK